MAGVGGVEGDKTAGRISDEWRGVEPSEEGKRERVARARARKRRENIK